MSISYTAADFGPLVLNTDVDYAVLDILKEYLPFYLAAIERERDLPVGYFDRPKAESYANTLEDDEFPDHAMPAIIVTSADTEGIPEKDGEGMHYAAWNVVISCVVRGRTPKETRRIASMFEGSVRRVMLNEGPPFDGEVRWTGTNVAAVADPTGGGRYLAAGMSTYLVYVDHAVKSQAGIAHEPPYTDPDDPDAEPDPLVTVGSVSVDVQGRTPQTDLGG